MTGACGSPAMLTPPVPAGAGTVPWEEVPEGHMSYLRGGPSCPAVSFQMLGSSLHQE